MGRRLAPALVALVVSLASLVAPAQAPPPPVVPPFQRLVTLEVVVNGAHTGTWLLLEKGGTLYASGDALDEWRLQLPAGAETIEFRGSTYWPLNAVPGFKSRLDLAAQTVELSFSPQAFAALRISRELVKRPKPGEVLPSVFVNYEANFSATRARGAANVRDAGILHEIGISEPEGVLTTSALARNLANDPQAGALRAWLRLETTLTHDFPEENRTLRVGDTTTRAAMWGREVYFGGVRFGTNFALTPGFVSQPIPALSGLSAAPSTVELYVNDVLRQVSNVPAGPFAIENLPTMTGNGEARLVVRDLLGRETVIVQSFFTTTQLLATGLDDWSVEGGRVRRDLGVASNNYGEGFAAGTWRHGWSDSVTLEGRAETGRHFGLAGASIIVSLPWPMIVKGSLAGSRDDGRNGGLWLAGLEYAGTHLSGSVQAQGQSSAFRQIGQDSLPTTIRRQLAGNLSYYTERVGAFGLGYAAIERLDDSRIRTMSGSYSIRIGASTLTATASRAIDGGHANAVSVNLIMPLDQNRIASATANSRAGQRDLYAGVSKNPGPDSEVGWRTLVGEQQNHRHAEGGLYYFGPYGNRTIDAVTGGDQSTVRLGANGGFVVTDGRLFASRRLEESFAVAEVPGYADIGIGLGSNVLAHTDGEGVALIPRLLPYQNNAVRIDPKELPVSAEIDTIEINAVPAWRSAVKVKFPVRSGRGALLKIVLDDGEVAPAGALVHIEGDREEFYVARRGEAFVTGLQSTNRVVLKWNARECRMDVTLPPARGDAIARVGPMACKGVMR